MRGKAMKIKKIITEKGLAANRANAKKSSGPSNTKATKLNGTTHGLLARSLVFRDEEESAEFKTLLDELERDRQPVGRMEQALVEEIGVCLWKMGTLNGLEQIELENRRKASTAILQAVAENCEDKPLPLFSNDDGSRSAAQLSWECRELIVRTGTNNSEREESPDGEDKTAKGGNTVIEARLNTTGEGLLRYSAAIKRDFYHATKTLRDIQRERNDHSE
jgi:hypothetical protein